MPLNILRRDWGPLPAEKQAKVDASMAIEAEKARLARGTPARPPWIPRRQKRGAIITDSHGNVRTDDWTPAPQLTAAARGDKNSQSHAQDVSAAQLATSRSFGWGARASAGGVLSASRPHGPFSRGDRW